MDIGFSAYSGADFLAFYIGLIVAAVIAGWWIPAFMRPDGSGGVPKRAETLAYLAGGKARFSESVVAALFGRGDLLALDKDIVKAPRAEGESEAERSMLAQIGSGTWREAKPSLADHADRLDRELSARGLLIAPEDRLQFRALPVLPYAFLVVLGLYRIQAGAAEGEAVGFLVGLTALAAVLGIIRFLKFNPRTRAGEQTLAEAQERASRLKSAPRGEEVGFAVALFGTAVLVGTPFEPLHAMRQAQQGGDSGGGGCGSDGGGDGGCGGGGCGGCGG